MVKLDLNLSPLKPKAAASPRQRVINPKERDLFNFELNRLVTNCHKKAMDKAPDSQRKGATVKKKRSSL